MKVVGILLVLTLMGSTISLAQPFLQLPIQGNYGTDFIIVNYVDWEESVDILDHQCGNKTYNGHQGTDFMLRSFYTMDSGINVLAAADGIVTYIKEGLFDREKTSDVSKGFGNYIAIKHFNGFYSYYAHLAKNSVVVEVGDTVKAGDYIALVGSSGNSSDPHLHFELWYDSIQLVDPFKGICGNSHSVWLETPDYDTSFNIWTSGLTNFIPTLDTLREELPKLNHFTKADESITYWSILYGVRKGDTLKINWYTPSGLLWFINSNEVPFDAWYFYYWDYIDVPAMNIDGEWSARLFRNNSFVDEIKFTSELVASTKEIKSSQFLNAYPNPVNNSSTIVWQTKLGGYTILELLDIFGNRIKTLVDDYRQAGEYSLNFDSQELPAGSYFYQLKVGDIITIKKIIVIK